MSWKKVNLMSHREQVVHDVHLNSPFSILYDDLPLPLPRLPQPSVHLIENSLPLGIQRLACCLHLNLAA